MGDSAVGVTPLHVNNIAPAVDAGEDARLLIGQAFTLAGSFADPGPDGWTATVDWGDGGGAQPLILSADKRFSQEKVYAEPGSYRVTVTVRDDDGGVGVDTVLVQVAAPGVAGRFVFYNHSFFD